MSNTLKKFVGNLPANCLSVLDHFVKLTLKGLRQIFKVDSKLYDFLTFAMWFSSKMTVVWIIFEISTKARLLCLPLVNWKSIIHLIFLICIIYALLTTELLLTITLIILTWLFAKILSEKSIICSQLTLVVVSFSFFCNLRFYKKFSNP